MRARNLKPGFFQNECLAELPIEARLLFAGLWCMADREGRLEDRPKRIKMAIFPADMLDVEPLLDGLTKQGLLIRYAVHGVGYIWIPSFLKHQRPHHKETASKIPPFTGDCLCAETRADHDDGAEMFHVTPGTPTKVGASTDLDTCLPALNPSSLNPDSPLTPRGGTDAFDQFWTAYPKRIGKAAAMRAWLRKGLNAKVGEIVAHLAERVRSDAQWLKQDGEFIPNPATWINRDGWLDEYVAEKRPRIEGI